MNKIKTDVSQSNTLEKPYNLALFTVKKTNYLTYSVGESGTFFKDLQVKNRSKALSWKLKNVRKMALEFSISTNNVGKYQSF